MRSLTSGTQHHRIYVPTFSPLPWTKTYLHQPVFQMDVSQFYGSMIGTLWFVSKSRWRACLIHGAGTNKRSLLLSSSTPTHLSTCCFVGRRAKSAGNRGKEARDPESRSSEDALQHAWALPSSACLYRIPLLNVCDSTSTLPSAWTTMTVFEPTQRWSSGQRLSSPPRSSVFTPVPARSMEAT
ncbi:unnamed protein product [Gadus morhua 'NCC']